MTKLKRPVGIAVMTGGVLVLAATLAWLVAYFFSRGAEVAVLRASFGSEFGHWAPVSILATPGLLLVFHGKRMSRDAPVSLLEGFEVTVLLVMVAVVLFLAAD